MIYKIPQNRYLNFALTLTINIVYIIKYVYDKKGLNLEGILGVNGNVGAWLKPQACLLLDFLVLSYLSAWSNLGVIYRYSQVVCRACLAWCRFLSPICEKAMPQITQLYGFSPVCDRKCFLRSLDWIKAASQTSHRYGLSPAWPRRWRFKLESWEKILPHNEHSWFLPVEGDWVCTAGSVVLVCWLPGGSSSFSFSRPRCPIIVHRYFGRVKWCSDGSLDGTVGEGSCCDGPDSCQRQKQQVNPLSITL